ncbi:hypothetical protein J5N97_026550 [Dioscorea zingiberensis]|uniref:Uncharacterized protein n=1 Tax=Dioscorea zingiberensis TaxID=325984 RepID=A0A9D5C3Q9_9LILI|nr:hypothetical protein J5N97_026550 [Dioscorea zingiberensis]
MATSFVASRPSTPLLSPFPLEVRRPFISPIISPFISSSSPNPIPIVISNKLPNAAWQPPVYVYPDPIPEFAIAETRKFREELKKKLLRNKDTFGSEIDEVVKVCVEIFSEFLHKEYGGPGTLLVEPFTDMLLALKDKKLPGAPIAARAALLWAQNNVNKDWEIWNSKIPV